jgi:hypothetical protein
MTLLLYSIPKQQWVQPHHIVGKTVAENNNEDDETMEETAAGGDAAMMENADGGEVMNKSTGFSVQPAGDVAVQQAQKQPYAPPPLSSK